MDPAQQVVEIEFLYLDLSSCGPCVASDASLREARALLRPVLEHIGVTLTVRSVHVITAAQAQALQLVSSPTIRVNGADVAGKLAETQCGDCTDISAGGAPVGCRVWRWRGQNYTEAPVGLIIDAVLRHLTSTSTSTSPVPQPSAYGGLPGNLARFFGTGSSPNA